MAHTNGPSGANAHEIASGIHRTSAPVRPFEGTGGLTFNQYLAADDESQLVHSGPRKALSLVRRAVATTLPVDALRDIVLSDTEAGAMLEPLAVTAPKTLVCTHGRDWRGDAAALPREPASALTV